MRLPLMILKQTKEFFFNIFFPKKCIHCGALLGYGTQISICEACVEKCLTKENPRRDFPEKHFDAVLCASYYQSHTRYAMLNFKFHSLTYLAPTFAHIMLIKLKEDYRFVYADVITSVPLCKERLKKRGYNQSDILAGLVSKSLSRNYINDLLIKVKNVPPLSRLTAAQRRKIVKNAYKFNNNYDIRGKTVMLVDDIFTTGSTANECAGILKKNGAAKVYVLCACETKEKAKNPNVEYVR